MDTEQQKSSETLLYNFDYPMVTECGAVKITADRVILQFPEKPTVYVAKFGNTLTKCNTEN